MPTKHRLPILPGTIRDVAYIRVEGEILDALRYEARAHNTSISFVGNTIFADAFGVKVKAKYYDYRKAIKRVRKTA